MVGDLTEILTCIRRRCWEPSQENLVGGLFVAIDDMPQDRPAAINPRRVSRPKKRTEQRSSLGAADPQYGERRAAGRCGKGHDGIIVSACQTTIYPPGWITTRRYIPRPSLCVSTPGSSASVR